MARFSYPKETKARGEMGEHYTERRQRAREAAQDALMSDDRPSGAIDEAIEVATRVKITPEAVVAMYTEPGGNLRERGANRLAAALRELGFEVEQNDRAA